ncbi:hypothetical protein J6590_062692 [Homalodisca vitripennis]|nr:hypothetical protein J6590_062692 [Homalodisca vitripennis]
MKVKTYTWMISVVDPLEFFLGHIARVAKSGVSARSLVLPHKSFVQTTGFPTSLLGSLLGYEFWNVSDVQVELDFKLQPLEHRRAVADAPFLFKLVRGILNCPELLQLIGFRIHGSTRFTETCTRCEVTTLCVNLLPRQIRSTEQSFLWCN